jgi:UDP-N-acetylmuramate dehydrogenase
MSEIKENYSLLKHNTFKVAARARFYLELNDIPAILEFLSSDLSNLRPRLVLGGGSNVLFTGDFDGIVIHPAIKGIEKISEEGNTILVKVGAGEDWDGFVGYCTEQGWGGVENLSFIPGTVGACPVQNIGAYGMEAADSIDSVQAIHLETGRMITLKSNECQFSYRNSIFKQELKDKTVITHVYFRLQKNHQYKTTYPDLQRALDNYPETTIRTIREAIISIRKNKLPDPSVKGNAGSFFKNPVIDRDKAISLYKFYPQIKGFRNADGSLKVSAAWLIEQSGWKGKRMGETGTHPKQPLIIVNHGGATGGEILQCALKIQKAVMNHFAIKLEMEVNIL